MTTLVPNPASHLNLQQVEAALCVWEELQQRSDLTNIYGAWDLRCRSIDIGIWVDTVYSLLLIHAPDHDTGSFDWEFVPNLLTQINLDDDLKIPTPESGLYHYLLAYAINH